MYYVRLSKKIIHGLNHGGNMVIIEGQTNIKLMSEFLNTFLKKNYNKGLSWIRNIR